VNGLFDNLPNPPAVHTTDPETSREALDTHESSGRRERHKMIVLDLVRQFPRRTAIELWELASECEKAALKEPQEIRRRLFDLHKTGQVHQRDARKCSVRGTRMMTWEA
jgi:hypothetical protein